jgi:polyphosphate kinase
MDTFEICWKDNMKARVFTEKQDNAYRKTKPPKIRSQFTTYEYYAKNLKKE